MTISFDANSGEGSMENIMLLDPQEIQLPANSFSKYGYVFNGWNTKADGTGVAYQNEELVTLDDNTVLYAQWKDCIVLYFYPNGGEGEIVEIAVDEPQKVVIPTIDIKREGYKFNYWNKKSDGSDPNNKYVSGNSIELKEDMNLYAQWRKYVTITYHPNGAEGAPFEHVVLEGDFDIFEDWYKYNRPGYEFVGWNTEPDGSGERYTTHIAPDSDRILYAEWYKIEPYVDLGLPSGLLWASLNIGAESLTDYGDYYAWGEVETKTNFTWACYKWCNGSAETLTKYCTNSAYGSVDNKTKLGLEDDVANVLLGGNWRLPTKAEFNELLENCEIKVIENAVKFTGKNGNFIMLPLAGFKKEDNKSVSEDTYGYYWTSDLYNDNPSQVIDLVFHKKGLWLYYEFSSDWYEAFRCNGLSIRPVLPK